jgi:signal transduction histidine kinase
VPTRALRRRHHGRSSAHLGDDAGIILSDDADSVASAYGRNVEGIRRRVTSDGLTALCAVFAAGAVAEDLASPTVTIDGQRFDRGPTVVIVGVLVAMVVLVALRRRGGLPVVLAAIGLCGVATLSARAWIIDSSFFFLFAMLITGIAGYLSTSRVEILASIAVLWGVAALGEWRRPIHSWQQFVMVGVFMMVGWGVGLLVRRPVVRAQTAEERAVQLEAEQAAAAERAAQEERRRIARELHDIIAHSVSVMTVQAGAVRRLLTPEQERERAALTRIEETGRDAMTEMRRLVGLLKAEGEPESLAPQPGLQSLDALVAKVTDAGLPVDAKVCGEPHALSAGVDLTAYRVVQEALTNALKYAGPAHACVTLTWDADELVIDVTNDGESQEQRDAAGHGQAGMRERLALYGGRLESGPGAHGGYVVRAHLPYEAARS